MITTKRKAIFASAAAALMLIAYFSPSAYRKAQMDKEVDRLCALDGGMKVIETVSLEADQFDTFGNPTVPLSTSKAAKASSFVVDASVIELVKGNPNGHDQPALHKFTSKVIRVSDTKVLGVAIGYYRFGGDPNGPWHPSSYTGCMAEPSKQLIRHIFKRATEGPR